MSAAKQEEILNNIFSGIDSLDEDGTLKNVEQGIAAGVDVLKMIDSLTRGIASVGDKFEQMVCFLPELIMAADIMEVAMLKLKPELEKVQVAGAAAPCTLVVANVKGDIHDIGRNILVALLRANHFRIFDLGHDVDSETIIDKAIEYNADVIGLSSLLTTSLPYARDVINLLDARGLRNQFKVIMGGGAVTPEYCEIVGTDAYGSDAASAVKVIRNLIS